MRGLARLIGLVSCFFFCVAPAWAETVRLRCEHMSGAFQGNVFSVIVNIDKGSISEPDAMGNNFVPVQITEQYYSYFHSNEHRRIDRTTGVMYFYGNGGWRTAFGNPGIVCSRGSVL